MCQPRRIAGFDRRPRPDTRRRRRRTARRRLGFGWSGADCADCAAAQPARRGPRRRVRHVLRRAVRPPAAVRPRCRGDQGRGHHRRSDAPAGGDLRGRQPRQAGDRRRPQASRSDGTGPPPAGRRRRGAAQPAPRRRRTAGHRRRLRAHRPPGHRLPLLAGLRVVRPEVQAAELRPAGVGLRRPVRRRRRHRQPPPPDVRQRGLLQRLARRLRLPARRDPPRTHRRGSDGRVPAAALVGVHHQRAVQA